MFSFFVVFYWKTWQVLFIYYGELTWFKYYSLTFQFIVQRRFSRIYASVTSRCAPRNFFMSFYGDQRTLLALTPSTVFSCIYKSANESLTFNRKINYGLSFNLVFVKFNHNTVLLVSMEKFENKNYHFISETPYDFILEIFLVIWVDSRISFQVIVCNLMDSYQSLDSVVSWGYTKLTDVDE